MQCEQVHDAVSPGLLCIGLASVVEGVVADLVGPEPAVVGAGSWCGKCCWCWLLSGQALAALVVVWNVMGCWVVAVAGDCAEVRCVSRVCVCVCPL